MSIPEDPMPDSFASVRGAIPRDAVARLTDPLMPTSHVPYTRAKSAQSVVDHPAHYNHSNIECIDALEDCMTEDQFRGFLKGNVIKYLWRADAKGNKAQDSAKAAWYSDRLAKFEEKIANK